MSKPGLQYVYVYYRIDPAQASLAATQIDALLTTMTPHCSSPPRRLCRSDGSTTWMEIYEGISNFDAFSMALSTAIETIKAPQFTHGERHTECFGDPAQAT